MHVNCDFTVFIIVVYMYTFFYGLLSLLKNVLLKQFVVCGYYYIFLILGLHFLFATLCSLIHEEKTSFF